MRHRIHRFLQKGDKTLNVKTLKRAVVSLLSLLAAAALSFDALAAVQDSAGSLIDVALAELDYAEGENSYSKYGDWYKIPHGDWCDMFVSWCADQAGISTSVLPHSASCTSHVNSFLDMDRYHSSAARGGSYVPKQGDLIFFYNPIRHPSGTVLQHVGIVLCVENGYVFTIEGNTRTNRLDDPSFLQGAPQTAGKGDEDTGPEDYVAVKYYPLDAERIHGYAEPDYQERTVYLPEGFADLGKYETLRTVFDALSASGIMPGTSRYTYSPRYGVTRGEFLKAVTELYGLMGWDASSEAFDDVPEDSAYYEAVMTARSAGIVYGSGSNAFFPDRYISPAEAQAVLSRTLRYVGQEDRTFDFSEGDFSFLLTPYTIRADVAQALYELLCEMSTPEEVALTFTVDGEPAGWRALAVSGEVYVSLDALRQAFPELETAEELPEEAEADETADAEETTEAAEANETAKAGETAEAAEANETAKAGETAEADEAGKTEEAEETEGAGESGQSGEEARPGAGRLPVPMAHCDRVLLSAVSLLNGEASADAASFLSSGVPYVNLSQAAELLGIEIHWDSDTETVELLRNS